LDELAVLPSFSVCFFNISGYSDNNRSIFTGNPICSSVAVKNTAAVVDWLEVIDDEDGLNAVVAVENTAEVVDWLEVEVVDDGDSLNAVVAVENTAEVEDWLEVVGEDGLKAVVD
jgi:hypothetical protein